MPEFIHDLSLLISGQRRRPQIRRSPSSRVATINGALAGIKPTVQFQRLVLNIILCTLLTALSILTPPSSGSLIQTVNARQSDQPAPSPPPAPPTTYYDAGYHDTAGTDQADETDFNEFAEFEVDLDHVHLPRSGNQASTKPAPGKIVEQRPPGDSNKNTAQTKPPPVDGQAPKSGALKEGQPSKVNSPTGRESKQSNKKKEENKAQQLKNAQRHQQQQQSAGRGGGVGDDGDDEDDEFDYKIDNTKPKEDLKVVNAPLPMKYTWDTYYVEIMFMIVIALYFVNFFIGSGKNEQIACLWYQANQGLFKQNFALVGGRPQIAPPAGDERNKDDSGEPLKPKQQQRGLIKETESSYVLWCSGRVGMEGLLVEINLLKRQDLISMLMNMLKPSKDNFIIRMQINQDSLDNFVFCLAQKSSSARLAKEMVDINTFCPERKPASRYGLNSEKLYLMNEIKEVATFLFDPKTSQLISKYEDCIDYIHITDQYSMVRQQEDMSAAQKLSSVKRMATFSFNFPKHSPSSLIEESSSTNGASDDGRQNTKTMVLLALTMIDRLRRFRLGRDGKQKSEKNRQKITDILQKAVFAQRQEAAQAKKDELRRLEKERIYEEDDPEKQRKWEKKEAKRELKKSRKVKQLKVKSKG